MAELQDIRERLARARTEQARSAEALCGAVDRATSSRPPPMPAEATPLAMALDLVPVGP